MENERIINIVPAPRDHGFMNFAEARRWAKENIVGFESNAANNREFSNRRNSRGQE